MMWFFPRLPVDGDRAVYLFSVAFQGMGAMALLWTAAAFLCAAWRQWLLKPDSPYINDLIKSGTASNLSQGFATVTFTLALLWTPELTGDPTLWQYNLSRILMVAAGVFACHHLRWFWVSLAMAPLVTLLYELWLRPL